jgi:Cu(I)/Ag(I) efflux system membrane fusion protein
MESGAGRSGSVVRGPVLITAASGLILALAALGVGYRLGGGRGEGSAAQTVNAGQKKVKFWTCSMHPQIKQPEKGLCPLCAMDLIPVYEGAEEEIGERQLVMSELARKLAEIETAQVERRFVETEVRLVGSIDYDETRLKHVAAWFPGRLDRMYVDYTGIPVRRGDHLVHIYSPELLAAQEELLQARRAYQKSLQGSSDFMKRSSEATLGAAREKLRLWGLGAEQVAGIETSGKASDRLTVHSPVGGIVIKKHLNQGGYVKTGTKMYTIADLSRVWVKLDAYESDMEWVRYGQKVEFITEAYPGQVFKGTITFIDPVLNPRTRTAKLRVIADNAEGKLQPGMFVHATVRPTVAAAGRVMDPNLAGKWVSPMHPEVVSEKPGKCTVCGMDLVKAEELGYVAARKANAPLIIPATAPLVTGKRAVVYVKVSHADKLIFEGREVVLGPRAGEHYIVRDGLKEGEVVVRRGAFKIDSALQIEAKPSMMSAERPTGPTGRTGPKPGPQRSCPVMGGKINKKVFTDYQGKRIYFCCPGCDAEFRKDPDKYLRKMRGAGVELEEAPGTKPPAAGKPQTTCPVMGGAINRKVFIDHGGKRIYFCCPGCDAEFKKDPEKYLEKLRDSGVKLEEAPAPAKSGGHHGH